ncbi:MAG: transposase [Thermoproteota archaeon]
MRNWKCEKLKNGVLFFKVDIKPEKFFIDSSGFSRRKKGSWRPTKFKLKIKRKWYKLYVLCNSGGESVAFAVTEGNVNDSVMFETLVKVLPQNSIVYGDKAYFSRKNYKIAKKYGIVLHSPPKKNARAIKRGIKEYRDEVKLHEEIGYDRWKEVTGYKERFNKEFVFAMLKTMFGEEIRAQSLEGAGIALLSMVSLSNIGVNA